MNTILKALFAISALSTSALAATINDAEFLNQKISRAEPISYDALRIAFENSPSYELNCSIERETNSEALEDLPADNEPFRRMLKAIPSLRSALLTFYFEDQEFGFDISAIKNFDGRSTEYDLGTSLKCEPTSDHACDGLSLEWTHFVGEHSENNDDPQPVQINERMDLFILHPREIYARLSVTAKIEKFSVLGKSSGHRSVSHTYVCSLKPIEHRLQRLHNGRH